MSKDDQKIDADDRNVFDVLNERKYIVDYFQREYSWKATHIEQLVTDLTTTFLEEHTPGNARARVAHYNNYYLGPFVVCSKDGIRSIIDGQQRLTSLTLLLIFLNNLQKTLGGTESIEPLVFSEKYGQKSFNIQVEERRPCLEKLFQDGSYDVKPDDDESTINMVARYANIDEAFPEEIKGAAFPYFLDWLKYNVILVEITAYSDDNAYTIFESMNDRGLNLTSTEMLKGYILSRFQDAKDREKANQFWKESIQSLHDYSKDEDQQFFQAWLRSQYADTIRQSKAGSSNEDFEKIGTRFHSWFRDNLSKMRLKADSPGEFRTLVHQEMKYYLRAYLDILDAQKQEKPGLEHVFYISQWGIAPSLSFPLMLAPLKSTDSTDVTRQKINEVARYIETFAVRRSINFRKFGASSIRYTMYTLVKELRGKDINSLRTLLRGKLNDMDEKWGGIAQFRLHGMNRQFVKFLLSRITGFIEQQSGAPTNFSAYFVSPGTKPYEVEHIWADKFEEHRDEFEQQHEFDTYRNRIGDLVLLPQGTNQSYGDMPYVQKVDHYLKENLLVKSLHPKAYENNPNFLGMAQKLGLKFKPYKSFAKADIDERQKLIQEICEVIWGDSGNS
ncbi:GmrSD restriction endonuclease domain-containing protein [Rhodoblastus sp.]|uniref:GmrSD restriction endonuclease domain-containing protein n=1 Tax=Rhodoblastus sp. TaxID=1962975 RepID=UPI003F952B18